MNGPAERIMSVLDAADWSGVPLAELIGRSETSPAVAADVLRLLITEGLVRSSPSTEHPGGLWYSRTRGLGLKRCPACGHEWTDD